MQTFYYKKSLDTAMQQINKLQNGTWVHIVTHDPDKIREYAQDLKVDEDALIDGIDLHESPRIEHEGAITYLYVRYCEPSGSLTSTEPLLIINTAHNIITVSRKPVLAITELLNDPEVLTTQPVKVTLQLLTKLIVATEHTLMASQSKFLLHVIDSKRK